MRQLLSLLLTALMLAAIFTASGCTSEPTTEPAPAEPTVSYSNVPEAYWDLFDGGSFDENNVWSTDDEQYAGMIAELKTLCEENAHGSIMVATDEKVIFAGGFGTVETDGVTTVNPFTTYEIGSVTKQFTSAAILQLAEQGKLNVNDTLDKFFPEYENGKKITVDNLLHMDSGIQDYVNKTVFFRGASQEERDSFTNGQMSDETILKYLYKSRQNFEPGSTFSYSNTNFWLLALIVEQVSGQTYEEYLKQNIFDVCNMPLSDCCETGNITSVPEAAEYSALGRCYRGSGDIHSNVCDILRWDRALFGEKIINKEQLDYMTTMRNDYSCGLTGDAETILTYAGSTDSYVAVNTIFNAEGIGRVYSIQMCPNILIMNTFMPGVEDIVGKYMLKDNAQ